jgi:glucose/arabinose dehydrogenase/enamine deaminase RidA (YjgF/YER057c/UK114 family)
VSRRVPPSPAAPAAAPALRLAGCLALCLAPGAAPGAQPVAYPAGYGPRPTLPAPDTAHRAQQFVRVVGWRGGERPQAPPGFAVAAFAEGLEHPRWLHVLPNGDVLVAESNNPGSPARDSTQPAAAREARRLAGNRGPSADRVTLLRDTSGDGRADVRVPLLTRAHGLDRPFGIALVGPHLYVASTDGVRRFPYRPGAPAVGGAGELVLPLPAGGYNNHWTRNLLASPDGRRLYVTVGSGTNVDTERQDARDPRRAAVLEYDVATGRSRVFAGGLRNPNGLAWEPRTGALWAAVNERDGLGDDLVPDYITRVRDGAFYGWPYSYYGPHEDPRKRGERPDLVGRAVPPDYATGAHTATMDVEFYAAPAAGRAAFPARYRGGAFVTQRGSWNRREFAGYRVLFVPFDGGRPSGPPEPFLTGFLADTAARTARGRPTSLAVLPDGSLLVSDDAGDRVWRVAPDGGRGGGGATTPAAQPPAAALRHLNPPTLHSTGGRYSHAVVAEPGRTVYVAGQVGLDSAGRMAGPDYRAQAERAMRNVGEALRAAGAGWKDVVRINTYLTSMDDLAALREVRAAFLAAPPPASTTVQVARLFRDDARIEVEVVAVVPR